MSPNYDLEAGAQAHFLKLTPRKRRLIRVFESLARMVLPLLLHHLLRIRPARSRAGFL